MGERMGVGQTIDEEEVRASILLSSTGKIADDAVDIGRGGHEQVHRVESRLCLAMTRDRFDDLFHITGELGMGRSGRWWCRAHGLRSPLKCQTF